MDTTGAILFITRNSFWIILLVVIIFITYTLWPRKKETKPEGNVCPESESKIDRTVRGFGIMKDKIANSEVVKRIQQAESNPDAFGLSNSLDDYGVSTDDNYQWGIDLNKPSKI